MADLENALSGILSDPDAMMKIKALGEQLGLSPHNTPIPEVARDENPKESSNLPLELFSKADPAMLSKITGFLPILSNMNQQDETTQLLCALRPFLSEERRSRLEQAEKILKIMRVLPFIRKSGLF